MRALRVALLLILSALCLAACQPPTPAPATATPLPPLTAIAAPTLTPTAAPASPTPAPPTATPYPPPPSPAAAAPTAYPEPAQAEVAQGRDIAILALQPSAGSVRVSGSTALPPEACIQTWLYANGRVVSWWPSEQCAAVREGRWVLHAARPPLAEQDPPGARYTVIAKSLAHPEAGEARLVMQAFIPYQSGGN